MPSAGFALSLLGLPEADLSTMSTHWILHRLYSLNPSSLDFPRRLYPLIWHDEQEQYLSNLQGPELARLVDFLDKVGALSSTFCPVMKRILQTLSAISADDDLSRKCLHKLQAICGHHTILPSSHIASGQITRVGDGPIARGVIADVWEGTYHGRRVLIRCLKAPLNNDRILKKVRSRGGMSLLRPLKDAYGCCSHSPKRRSSGKG